MSVRVVYILRWFNFWFDDKNLVWFYLYISFRHLFHFGPQQLRNDFKLHS